MKKGFWSNRSYRRRPRGASRTIDFRTVVNAIKYMLDTECQWRTFPLCFLPVTTVRNYFYTWRNDGGYDQMMDRLRVFGRELAGRSETQTAAAINIQSGCQ